MTARLLPESRRRPRPEPIVPMINVVFLLLIFFLMTASFAPPAPFEITPPVAPGDADREADTLYLSAEGEIAFGSARNDEALALAAASGPVRVMADARLRAADLTGVLARLARLGAPEVQLVTAGER